MVGNRKQKVLKGRKLVKRGLFSQTFTNTSWTKQLKINFLRNFQARFILFPLSSNPMKLLPLHENFHREYEQSFNNEIAGYETQNPDC